VTALALADDGARGAGSALLGTVLVVAFLAAGLVPLALVRGQQTSAAFGAGVLLLNYTLRLALAVLVLSAATRSDAVDPRWTAFAVIAAALAWTAGQAAAVLGRGDHDQGGHRPPQQAG
jgi:hypothetical protein